MPGARHWVFTLNNYTDADVSKLECYGEALGGGDSTRQPCYLVYGFELSESGTPHLQGYVAFLKRLSLRSVKAVVSSRAHCEVARGTPEEASIYCKKSGTFKEYGCLPCGRGRKSSLGELAARIRSGATEEAIELEFPAEFIRYRSNILAQLRARAPARSEPPNVIILWGRTGTGKSRSVYDFHELSTIYKHDGGSWFDGYEGHIIALFDDYSGSEFKLAYLLKLLDRYPMRVPVKGGFVQWNPRVIYFTSNLDPKDWYRGAHEEHQAALFRRVNEIKFFE